VHKESGLAQERIADLTSVLHETISGVKVVKAFGMEEFENRKFSKESNSYFRTILRVTNIRNLASPTTEFLSAAAGGVIIWYGGLQVSGQEHGRERVPRVSLCDVQLMPPIKELSNVNNRIQEASAAGKRVFEVLDYRAQHQKTPPMRVDLPAFSSDIRFEGVSFRYGDGETVLDGITLKIRKGEVVAIVGPSGAGKSTLIDLGAQVLRSDRRAHTYRRASICGGSSSVRSGTRSASSLRRRSCSTTPSGTTSLTGWRSVLLRRLWMRPGRKRAHVHQPDAQRLRFRHR